MVNGQENIKYKGISLKVNTGEEIGRRLFYFGSYEPDQEAALVELIRPGDTFFDVGANMGIFSLLASAAGAKVFAFEPSQKVYQFLTANIESNNRQNSVITIPEAVSDKEGAVQFFETRTGNYGVGRIINFNPNVQKESYEVKTNTLESFVKKYGSPSVLKIDVEGAEYPILKGASGILKEISPTILVEFHPKEIKAFGGDVRECLDILSGCGYEATRGHKIDSEKHSWDVFKKTRPTH